METIKINGKTLRVSASDERCLWILKESNFAAKKSEFVEGRYARYRNTILPRDRKTLADLGISELSARTNGYDFLSPENYARITGEKEVSKTSVAHEVADQLGMRLEFMDCASMDLVNLGILVPNTKRR